MYDYKNELEHAYKYYNAEEEMKYLKTGHIIYEMLLDRIWSLWVRSQCFSMYELITDEIRGKGYNSFQARVILDFIRLEEEKIKMVYEPEDKILAGQTIYIATDLRFEKLDQFDFVTKFKALIDEIGFIRNDEE